MLVPVIIAVLLVCLIYKLTARPATFPNGPWNLPIVGYLPFMGRRPYLTLRELSKKYGDIFSINLGGYRAIVLSSYDMIRDGFKEENFTGRPPLPFFKFRSEERGIVFSTGHNWAEVRRFTLRNLRDFGLGKTSLERVIQEEIREVIESYKKKAGKPLKLNYTFNLAIVNALWTIITGQRFDLDDPEANSIIVQFSNAINEDSATGLSQLIPLLHYMKGLSKSAVAFVSQSKSMFKEIINEHKRVHVEGDASDFMHVFLDRMHEDEKQGKSTPFTGEDGMTNLIVTTLDLFAAGSETTSTTLLWVFLFLSTHPDVQDKVQQELDTVVGKERMPSYDDKASMPYTEAVLLECQRFASAVPFGLFHCATADTKFKGYIIPKDTIIIQNLYQVLRDPKTWEKPDEFYPEHFLTKDGKVQSVQQFIPFSTGKRACLGEGLAKIQLFLFTTALLQQFKFTLPAGQPKPTMLGPSTSVLSPKPYDVILTLRK